MPPLTSFDFRSKIRTVNGSVDKRILLKIPDSVALGKSLTKGRIYIQIYDKSGVLVVDGLSSIYYDKTNGFRLYFFKKICDILIPMFGTSGNSIFDVKVVSRGRWAIQECI